MFRLSKKHEIYFDEFLVYCEFFSPDYKFSGHIQKINSRGFCVIFMNEDKVVQPLTEGTLRIFCKDEIYDFSCSLRWVDNPSQFLRHSIAKVDDIDIWNFLKKI